ncbi:AMP-binding protein [Streptomyces sp. NPDC020875]|uniref:AMP-binding protein n=1 Tax=Streptomyces sp. NPDC020875 TaxID=3154898 RepID=UPI003401D504
MAGGTTLHELFERGVRAAGKDRTAVITDRVRLSYGQLDTRAARLARHLTETAEIGPGDLVAVRTLRAPDVVVAVLAVLRTGAAFTVVSPSGREPAELADARAVISHRVHSGRLTSTLARPLILLDGDSAAIDARPDTPLDAPSGTDAALLFTAGTTGAPRAVPVPHARLTAAYAAWSEVFRLGTDDRVLVTAAPDTAAFTAALVRVLGAGATLVLGAGEPYTVADTDPVTAGFLTSAPGGPQDGLRLLVVGGERIRLADHVALERRLTPGTRLIGLYGPAEVAGCGTWFETAQLTGPVREPAGHAYLGRPFTGVTVELRGKRIWLTPPDGGDAIPTGDQGRRDGEGPLEFLGRTADRFKVGGRTVDPYRVEAALVTHPAIRDVLVAPGASAGDRPVAHVVPEPGYVPDEPLVRAHLAKTVHSAETPAVVVRIAALPRTAAGRLDRGALTRPVATRPGPRPGRVVSSGKGAPLTREETLRTVAAPAMLIALVLSISLTNVLWPGSTDLSIVPDPWAWYFRGLYIAEHLAFVAGVGFLIAGRTLMPRDAAPGWLTTLAHLAIVYLLASWWPQDNFYRLAAKQDWERQAALVYAFNIPLMLAAAVVACWAWWVGTHERERD